METEELLQGAQHTVDAGTHRWAAGRAARTRGAIRDLTLRAPRCTLSLPAGVPSGTFMNGTIIERGLAAPATPCGVHGKSRSRERRLRAASLARTIGAQHGLQTMQALTGSPPQSTAHCPPHGGIIAV